MLLEFILIVNKNSDYHITKDTREKCIRKIDTLIDTAKISASFRSPSYWKPSHHYLDDLFTPTPGKKKKKNPSKTISSPVHKDERMLALGHHTLSCGHSLPSSLPFHCSRRPVSVWRAKNINSDLAINGGTLLP